jgi:hypothetical protein
LLILLLMRIISIAGATSKAGKTLLAEQLIRYCTARHSPVYAVKFTTTSDLPSPCPRGAPCTVCDLSENFRIIRDPEILKQKGKNTARFYDSGATEVIWVVAKKSQLPIAYGHLLTHLPHEALVLMEGSTIISISRPDLVFYVFANHIAPQRWKESAKELIARSDFVVINQKSKMKDHPDLVVPNNATRLDLAMSPVTSLPEVRDKIEDIIRSIYGCHDVQSLERHNHS